MKKKGLKYNNEWTEIRKYFDLSQKVLGNFLGVTRSNMSMIEMNERKLPNNERTRFIMSFLYKRPVKIPSAEPYGLTNEERENFLKQSDKLELQLIVAKNQYKNALTDLNRINQNIILFQSMDFSNLGKEKKSMEMHRDAIVSDMVARLYLYQKSTLMSMEMRIVSFEATLNYLKKELKT